MSEGPIEPFTRPLINVAKHNVDGALNAGKGFINKVADLPANTAKFVLKKSLGIVKALAKNLPIFPGPNNNLAKQLIHVNSVAYRAQSGRLFEGMMQPTRERIDKILAEPRQTQT